MVVKPPIASRISSVSVLVLAVLLAASPAAGQKSSAAQQKQQQEKKKQQIEQALRQVDRQLLSYATSDARKELQPVIAEDDAGVDVALGRILEQEKKYDEAIAKLKKASQAAPGDPAPWVFLGLTYVHQRRDDDARSAFAEAEKRAAAEVTNDPKNALATYYQGVAQQRLGQYGAAMETLRKARQLAPDDPLPVYQLGVTRTLEQKHWQEAVDYLTEALEMSPNLAYAYFYRGQAASKLKRTDMLIADFERFVALAPEAPEAKIAARIVASVKR